MSDRVQFRRDTKARWSEVNPILMEGEMGLEIDTNNIKMGDGVHAWNELEYGVGIENITSEVGDSENLAASQKLVTYKFNDLSILSDNGNWQLIKPNQNLVGHLYEYGYVLENGDIFSEIENHSNHVLSSLIPIKAGITYELNSTATDGARPGVFLDYKGNVISVIAKGTTSIIAPNNAEYLIACTALVDKDTFYVRPTEGYVLDERSAHYIPLLKNVENNTAKLKTVDVKSEIGFSSIDLLADDTEQYINQYGELIQGGGFRISKNEIILNPGYTIYLYARGYKQEISMISKEKGDDNKYNPLSVSIDSEFHIYEFTNYENIPIKIVLSFISTDDVIAYISGSDYNDIGNLSFARTRNTLYRPHPAVSKLTTQKARGIKYLEVYYEPIADETRKLILAYVGYYKPNGNVFFQFKKDENQLHTSASFCIDLMYGVDAPPTGTQLIVLNEPVAGCFLKAIVDFDVIEEYTGIFLDINAFPYDDISKNNPDYISRIINVETADYVSTQTDGAYIANYGAVVSGGSAMYSKPFLLKSKETISVYAKSYNKSVSIINEVLEEDKSYKTLVIGVDSKPRRYVYTNNTGHDIYIAISSLSDVDVKVIAILNKNEIIDAKLKTVDVKSEIGLSSSIDLLADDTEQYINQYGELIQGGGFRISKNEIILNPGYTIYLYARGYKQEISMISKEKGDDNKYNPLSVSIDSEFHIYEFTNYENIPIKIVLSFISTDDVIAYISGSDYNDIGNLSFARTRNTLYRPHPAVSKLTTQKARGIKYLEVYYEPIADETRKLILAYVGYYKPNGNVFFQFKKDENQLHTSASFCIDLMYGVDAPPTGTQLIVLNEPVAGCFLKAIVDFDVIEEYTGIFLDINAFPYDDISKNNPDYISRIINVETADYVSTQTDGAYIANYGAVVSGGSAMYSKPFLLKSKETISVYAKSYNKSVSIINEVLEEDKSYKTLVIGVDSKPRRYVYTNNTGHDIYIAISSLSDVDVKVIAILNRNEIIDAKLNNTTELNKTTELDFNFMQSLKPLEQVLDTPRFAGLIHQWAFIGDSLNSGEVYINNSTGRHAIDAYEWSWGQAICRLCGTQGTNFSRGGLKASDWWEAYVNKADKEAGYHTGGTHEKFTDRKFNAYTISLGTNECNQSYNIGSADDVDLSDYNNNRESFYGYYCKIIQYIREINPSAKIFLITIPALYHDKGESYGVNKAVRTIANMFDNCFLVDLYKYLPKNSEIESKYIFWGHLTAAGYQWMGYVMANLLSYIIENNLASFKNVPYIGTQYDDGNLT